MKIEKKTIIIIAIVAVVAFFIYKKWKENKALAVADPDTGERVTLKFDANTYKKLISRYCGELDSEVQKKVLSMSAGIYNSAKNNSNYTYAGLKQRADENGFTYDQQIIVEALYQVLINQNNDKAAGQAIFNGIVEKMRGW